MELEELEELRPSELLEELELELEELTPAGGSASAVGASMTMRLLPPDVQRA